MSQAAALSTRTAPRRAPQSPAAPPAALRSLGSPVQGLREIRASRPTTRPSTSRRVVSAASGRVPAAVRAQATSELPANLQKLVTQFQMVPDPKARYKQLLFFAGKLPPMAADDHTPENKVEGCVSQVWVKPELKDGKVFWTADSDSQLTKGLAALLVQGLSECTPEDICRVEPDFIEALGLKQSLTPSRNNGFLNMLKLMQKKSLQLIVAEAKEDGAAPAEPEVQQPESATPITDAINRKLEEALSPSRLAIINESDQHAGHAGVASINGKAGSTGETHFKVEVVSERFAGMNTLKRHRMIYQMLSEEFGMGLHALSLDTKTPEEAA